jgi:hypothetical protein
MDAAFLVTTYQVSDDLLRERARAGRGSCALSADAKYLANDNVTTVTVTDVATGEEAVRLEMAATESAARLAFSPDNRYLAAVGSMVREGVVTVWLLQPEDLLTEVCRRVPQNADNCP